MVREACRSTRQPPHLPRCLAEAGWNVCSFESLGFSPSVVGNCTVHVSFQALCTQAGNK